MTAPAASPVAALLEAIDRHLRARASPLAGQARIASSAVAGDFAVAYLDADGRSAVAYLLLTDGHWQVIELGGAILPADLARLGIPRTLWPAALRDASPH